VYIDSIEFECSLTICFFFDKFLGRDPDLRDWQPEPATKIELEFVLKAPLVFCNFSEPCVDKLGRFAARIGLYSYVEWFLVLNFDIFAYSYVEPSSESTIDFLILRLVVLNIAIADNYSCL